jgi:hypothetical protein
MKGKQKEVSAARRGFFRSVTAIGALAGTGALILRNPQVPAAPVKVAEPVASGYLQTAHIRKYYDTTRG